MKFRKLTALFLIVCMLFTLTACGKKCSNGCGQAANPDCYADMCDKCCDYYMGLNGCYANH